ncbi:MAG: hypothetical protein GX242_01380 [Clostridiales bacterium]|nr:hypothetical protein [Clostridiales bacterium]
MKKKLVKKLNKKQIILLCVAAALLLAAIALSIVLPLALKKDNGIPKPYVNDFDQTSDMYVTVSWKKVKGALGYSLQYVYGNVQNEDDIVTVKTEGLYYRIERQKDVLAYRVKALSNDRDSDFSPWQYFNVNPLKLDAPQNATLNRDGILSWTNVKYQDRGVLKTVPTYVVDLMFEGEYFDVAKYTGTKTETNVLKGYVKGWLLNLMSHYDEETDTWKDITLTVRIKGLNYYDYGGIKTEKGYEFLYKAYDESEYYEKEITIDENLFKSIKG